MIRSMTLIALLVVGTSAFAGPKHGPMLEEAIEKLELDDARAEQVLEIFEQGKLERQSLKEAGASKEDMRALRTSQKEKLAEVLSEEELKDLRKMTKKRHQKHDKDCDRMKENMDTASTEEV